MPTAATPSPDAGGQTPSAPAPAPQKSPTIAPIRDKSHGDHFVGSKKAPNINPLPGVIDKVERGAAEPERDIGDDFVERGIKEAAGQKPEAGPARGPDGKFLSTKPATDADTDPDAPTQTPAPEPAPTTGPVTFLGKQYKTLAEAEHTHKTLQGMYSSEKKAASENYSAALAWKQRADELDRELQALRQTPNQTVAAGQPSKPGETAPSSAAEPSSFTDAFDWDTYNTLVQMGRQDAADIFRQEALVEFVEKKVAAKYEKQIAELQAPIQQSQKVEAYTVEVAKTVANLADNGYPEFRDPAARKAIMDIWQHCGLPEEQAKHPFVLASAVAHYRLLRASSPQSSTSAPPSAEAAAAGAEIADEFQQFAAQHSTSGVVQPPPGTATRVVGRAGNDPVENIKAGMHKARIFGTGKNGTLPGVLP